MHDGWLDSSPFRTELGGLFHLTQISASSSVKFELKRNYFPQSKNSQSLMPRSETDLSCPRGHCFFHFAFGFLRFSLALE